MSRHLLFVLLLTTGVALAAGKPQAKQDATAVDAPAKTEAEQTQTEHAQTDKDKEKAQGQTADAPAKEKEGAKLTSVPGGTALGMSVLGNQEAPTSLVIVPWKTSELGDTPGIVPMLDDSKQPVDKEVFMRALRYYEIRSGKKR
jgi:hypothetical protein